MADTEVSIRWAGDGLRFEAAHPSGNNFNADGDGKTAHSPVQMLALALASCTAADVVDIAEKMRVSFASLTVDVSADRNKEPPRYFTAVRIKYRVRGLAPEDRPKIERAIELSHEKYCSVSHSMRKDMQITSELILEQGS